MLAFILHKFKSRKKCLSIKLFIIYSRYAVWIKNEFPLNKYL